MSNYSKRVDLFENLFYSKNKKTNKQNTIKNTLKYNDELINYSYNNDQIRLGNMQPDSIKNTINSSEAILSTNNLSNLNAYSEHNNIMINSNVYSSTFISNLKSNNSNNSNPKRIIANQIPKYSSSINNTTIKSDKDASKSMLKYNNYYNSNKFIITSNVPQDKDYSSLYENTNNNNLINIYDYNNSDSSTKNISANKKNTIPQYGINQLGIKYKSKLNEMMTEPRVNSLPPYMSSNMNKFSNNLNITNSNSVNVPTVSPIIFNSNNKSSFISNNFNNTINEEIGIKHKYDKESFTNTKNINNDNINQISMNSNPEQINDFYNNIFSSTINQYYYPSYLKALNSKFNHLSSKNNLTYKNQYNNHITNYKYLNTLTSSAKSSTNKHQLYDKNTKINNINLLYNSANKQKKYQYKKNINSSPINRNSNSKSINKTTHVKTNETRKLLIMEKRSLSHGKLEFNKDYIRKEIGDTLNNNSGKNKTACPKSLLSHNNNSKNKNCNYAFLKFKNKYNDSNNLGLFTKDKSKPDLINNSYLGYLNSNSNNPNSLKIIANNNNIFNNDRNNSSSKLMIANANNTSRIKPRVSYNSSSKAKINHNSIFMTNNKLINSNSKKECNIKAEIRTSLIPKFNQSGHEFKNVLSLKELEDLETRISERISLYVNEKQRLETEIDKLSFNDEILRLEYDIKGFNKLKGECIEASKKLSKEIAEVKKEILLLENNSKYHY